MSIIDNFRLDLLDDWMIRAACSGHDTPDLFFPARGESTAAAKAICRRCPVRPDCLNYALATNERFGVWGGTTERERRHRHRATREDAA